MRNRGSQQSYLFMSFHFCSYVHVFMLSHIYEEQKITYINGSSSSIMWVLWFELRASRLESSIFNFWGISPTRVLFFFLICLHHFPTWSPPPQFFCFSLHISSTLLFLFQIPCLYSLPMDPLYFPGYRGYILTSEDLWIIVRCSTH